MWFLAVVTLLVQDTVARCGIFINPYYPPGEGARVQWRPGTVQTITWNSTEVSPYNITLWQQFPASRGIDAINLGSVCVSTIPASGLLSYDWTVDSLGANLNDSMSFLLWMNRGATIGWKSACFNITDAAVTATNTSSTTAPTTIERMTRQPLLIHPQRAPQQRILLARRQRTPQHRSLRMHQRAVNVSTTDPSSDPNTSAATSSAAASNSNISTTIGAGVGAGVGTFLLLLAVGTIVLFYRRKQKRQVVNAPAQAAQATELSADDEYISKAAHLARRAELSSSAQTGKYSTHPSAQRGIEYQEVDGQGLPRELP